MTNPEISNLVSELTEEKLSTLVYEIIKQDKLCIPQFYLPSHLEHYGFKSMKEMNENTNHLYQFIDEMVMDIEL